jgi:hypothetical protein
MATIGTTEDLLKALAKARQTAPPATTAAESLKDTKNTFRQAGKAAQSATGTAGNGKAEAVRVGEVVAKAGFIPLAVGGGIAGGVYLTTEGVKKSVDSISSEQKQYSEALKYVLLFGVGYLLLSVVNGKSIKF